MRVAATGGGLVLAEGLRTERDADTARAELPGEAGIHGLARAAAACTACPLHEDATQTVFGEGPPGARLVVVGEQPGDEEDRTGRPFVGAAGRELDRAFEAVGIHRDEVYVTNAVKHFKFTRRGTRRIHETPTSQEIDACMPWTQAEIARVRPVVVLGLGATASQALIGPSFKVTRHRGRLHAGIAGTLVTGTVHPAAILRSRDGAARRAARAAFHEDLRGIAVLLHEGPVAALELRTRDHVYRLAQDLEVEGRSSMTKAELVQAVVAGLELAAGKMPQVA